MQNYGEFFKYQREAAGLNQPELAKKIGTSQTNVSRWERGIVLPSIDFCVKLANFYGISLDELVGISEVYTSSNAAPMGESVRYSEEEKKLIEDYRYLNAASKKLVKQTVETLRAASAPSEKRKSN